MGLSAQIPPQAPETEQTILASMMHDEEAVLKALDILEPEDFYQPAHSKIFQAMQFLNEHSIAIDLLSVENRLREKDELLKIGGTSLLTDILLQAGSSSNIEYYCQIVKQKAIRRRASVIGAELHSKSFQTETDVNSILEFAEKSVFELATRSTNIATNMSSRLVGALENLEELRQNDSGITGVPTGLDLDRFTGGFQRGELIIIAARPAMGKTAFALSAFRNASLKLKPGNDALAIFSLEMSIRSLINRFLTMEARVDAQNALRGKISDQEMSALVKAAEKLSASNIFIDDTPSLSISELKTKSRRLKLEHNIQMIVVDYLQLMVAGSDDIYNREQEIAAISRGLKSIAKELDIPVVALSQLSRAVEQRSGEKRPQLSDLRESGSIEQDADIVIFLYRPEYYGVTTTSEGQSTTGIAEVIIGKQRNGPTGTITLNFIKKYARFENLISANDSPGF